MENWIKVNEQKPKVGESILAYFGKNIDCQVVAMLDERGFWIEKWTHQMAGCGQITHWQPLPDKPTN